MSVWNALWSNSPFLTGAANNPQGVTAACVGALYIGSNGVLYRKRGGGCTKYGWYIEDNGLSGGGMAGWDARFSNTGIAVPQTQGGAQALALAPGTAINQQPSQSGSTTLWPSRRQYIGGYTAAPINSAILFKALGANTDTFPSSCIGGGYGLSAALEWDWYCDLITTPRGSTVATTTDLTETRIWAGVIAGSANIQAVGATGNSENLQTEFPTAYTVLEGEYGVMFRYSSAVPDPGWVVVSCSTPGGVVTQSVSGAIGAIAADSQYRLRLRMQLRSGVPTVFASINDGTEVAITSNVGPGTVPAVVLRTPLAPYLLLRKLGALNLKSIVMMGSTWWWGQGCEA